MSKPRRAITQVVVVYTALIPAVGFVAAYWDHTSDDARAPIATEPVIAWGCRNVLHVFDDTGEEVPGSRCSEVVAMVHGPDIAGLEAVDALDNLLGTCPAGREHDLYGEDARKFVADYRARNPTP